MIPVMNADNKRFPLVTISIPTYNRADRFLRHAIASASAQTYPNIEIIVSDNCSSDNTEAVVGSFHDSRIRYFRQDINIGANNNFNFCLQQAKGEYFLLLQDDDLIDADFVSCCIAAAGNSERPGIIRTGTRVIDSENHVLWEAPNMAQGGTIEEFFMKWFGGKTALYLCSTLFNTEKLKASGGFRSAKNLFQDVFAEIDLAARFGRIDIREVKASFRKHPDEMTFLAKIEDWCDDSLLLLDFMCGHSAMYREMIRKEGMAFFCRMNYRRAVAVRTPLKRLVACMIVFRKFNYRYRPPFSILIPYRMRMARRIRNILS